MPVLADTHLVCEAVDFWPLSSCGDVSSAEAWPSHRTSMWSPLSSSESLDLLFSRPLIVVSFGL